MLAAKILVKGTPRDSYEGRVEDVTFPKIGTPKIDGIRGIMTAEGKLVTRKKLPVPNDHVRMICEAVLRPGMDGEIWIPGHNFNQIQSKVMSVGGTPDFRFMAFDTADQLPYINRIANLRERIESNPEHFFGTAEYVESTWINSLDELIAYNELNLARGFEGSCFRNPHSPYKFGRSTFNEQYLLKFKQKADAEATIIGYVELKHNTNSIGYDELGYIKRSKSIRGLQPGNKLGALIVHNPLLGTFEIGTGFNEQQRRAIWLNRNTYLGKIVTFEYVPYGMKQVPRHPVFKGFRLD
jgi:DNA ligase-1